MRETTCFCGETVAAGDLAALVPVALAHFDRAHPELGLREHQIRDYLEAEDRLTGPTERLPEIGEVIVQELSPDHLGDLLDFFDHDAFAGNPGWASCYCMCHHVGSGASPQWLARTASQNRADLVDRVRSGATTGVVAYVDGRLAAWCNASVRSAFPEHVGGDEQDDQVGAVACFVIAPPYRRHGLAGRLLAQACRSFAQRGITLVEAYPRKESRDDASAYHGPLSLYQRAGFAPVAEHGQVVVVRKQLTPLAG